jgi:hypothetical protein
MLKRHILALVIGLTASASAGLKLNYNVAIADYGTYKTALGGTGTVRNSADTMQWIGCDLYASPTSNSLNCSARDTAGNFLTCYNRTNLEMRQMATNVGEGSYIYFQTDPADTSLCKVLLVRSGSLFEPKI